TDSRTDCARAPGQVRLPPQTFRRMTPARIAPFETRVYVVMATLTQYKLETDTDYHLVIKDGAGNTMIAEIPDPTCVGSGNPFKAAITNARNQFNAVFTVST